MCFYEKNRPGLSFTGNLEPIGCCSTPIRKTTERTKNSSATITPWNKHALSLNSGAKILQTFHTAKYFCFKLVFISRKTDCGVGKRRFKLFCSFVLNDIFDMAKLFYNDLFFSVLKNKKTKCAFRFYKIRISFKQKADFVFAKYACMFSQWASSQFLPQPKSALRGTESGKAFSIS